MLCKLEQAPENFVGLSISYAALSSRLLIGYRVISGKLPVSLREITMLLQYLLSLGYHRTEKSLGRGISSMSQAARCYSLGSSTGTEVTWENNNKEPNNIENTSIQHLVSFFLALKGCENCQVGLHRQRNGSHVCVLN